jgi:molybdate transport system ATP-binding protein
MQTEGSPLIKLEHCSVKLGDSLSDPPSSQWALDDVSFELCRNERWVLVGANGSGKSVLLKLLRGDMWPTPTGRERRQYGLSDIAHEEPGDDKRHIAYLAPERQDKYLRYGWSLSVTQVVTTGLFDEDIPLTKPTAQQQAQVCSLLKRLRLWSLRERSLLTLSYGQRRRALLARMLVAQPQVLLLDEVFNGVDAVTRQQLRELLDNTRVNPTWILAAHSAADIPTSATHLARLQHGKLVYAGPLDAQQLIHLQRDVQTRHRAAQRRVAATRMPRPRINTAPQLIMLRNVELYRDYRPVLKAVNWTVQRGEHWAIVGANGSGKSSLLMLLYGDLHPAHTENVGGLIERAGFARGTPISQWKQRVGYVSPELQAGHYATHSLEEIVATGRYASVGLNEAITTADRRAARPWLKFFGIDAARARGPREVSYGQLRLALLARAMINRPPLLLLDEPFTGLDPDMHAYVMAVLQRVAEAGTQIIMAIHDAADILPAVKHVLKIECGGRVTLHTLSTAMPISQD